jgi:predicted outer membrane protein
MKKFMVGSLIVLLAFAAQAIAQSTSSSQTQSNQTSDQPGAGGVSSGATGDTSTSPADQSDASGAVTESSSRSATQGATGARRNSLGAGAQSLGAQSAHGGLEQHIATCLALGNQEEVALAKFAQQRATNPQVKQFAETMIQEHQQAIQQLHQAVPQVASLNLQLTSTAGGQSGAASSEQPGSSSAANRASSATAGADRSALSGAESSSTGTAATGSSLNGNQRGSAAGGDHQQMVDFARTVKQNCLRLSEQALGQKQGAEFDKAYIGQQIVAHTNMLAELQAAQQFASNSQLQPLLQQATQMTEHHLTQARTIMDQLEQASGQGGQGSTPRAGAPARSR